MKHKQFLMLTQLLTLSCVSHTSHTMQIASHIKQPTHVACLHNKTYAIAGKNGLVFFNTKTLEQIHVQENELIDDLAANNIKTKIATSCNGMLTVYNAVSGEKEWHYDTLKQQFTPITFNSQNSNELIAYIYPDRLQFFTDHNHYHTAGIYTAALQIPTRISCHPQKQDIVYIREKTDSWYQRDMSISIYHKEPATCPNHHLIPDNCDIHAGFCLYLKHDYSPGGHYSAQLTANDCCYVFDQTGSSNMFRASDTFITSDFHIASAFHPNHPIIALLTDKYLLEYYRFTDSNPFLSRITQSLAEYDTPLDKICSKNLHRVGNRITFSHCGKYIFIALANKCFRIPVPFEVLYTPEIKDKLVSLLWGLKNGTLIADLLCKDIVHVIFKTQLKVHRFSKNPYSIS